MPILSPPTFEAMRARALVKHQGFCYMSSRILMLLSAAILLFLIGWGFNARGLLRSSAPPAIPPAPPVAPAPVPLYIPPDYQQVLAGKAPLRVLIVSKKTMLAWKSESAVQVSAATAAAPLL